MRRADNVISFKRQPSGVPKTATSDSTWEFVCNKAIMPSFDMLRQGLQRETKVQKVGASEFYARPFLLLSWSGEKGLKGQTVALHFTYGGCREGKRIVGFDLSALKFTEEGTKLQTSYMFRAFDVDVPEGDLLVRVFHFASLGLGYATALEDMPGAKPSWRVIRQPAHKMC